MIEEICMTQMNMRMTKEAFDELDQLAQRLGISKSETIRMLVHQESLHPRHLLESELSVLRKILLKK